MPRKSKNSIQCQFFTWNLLVRDGVFYGDGRGNKPNLGKHSLGERDRAAALEALRELDHQKAVEMGLAEPVAKAGEIAVKTGWDLFTDYCQRPSVLDGVTATTRKRYRAVKDHHQAFCAKENVTLWTQFTDQMLQKYIMTRHREEAADNTIYLEVNTIKHVVNYLIDDQRILAEEHRLARKVKRSEESHTYCYSKEEVQAIVQFCSDTTELNWLMPLIVCLASTGMRIGEAASLRWSDINYEANYITLPDNRRSGRLKKLGKTMRTNKGGYTRRVPIHPTLRQELQQLHRHVDGRVFHGPKGGTLKPDTVRNILIHDVLMVLRDKFPTPEGEIGFEDGRLHSFRHYFVSQAFLGGASEGEIREWVGHADSRIVERYRHLRNVEAQLKMSRIDFLGGSITPQSPEPATPTESTLPPETDNKKVDDKIDNTDNNTGGADAA